MNSTGQSKTRVSAPKGSLSVKIISILLVGFLVVGTVPTTHSYPSAKADFNNIWLAAKEFWDSLHFFHSQQAELENKSVIAEQQDSAVQAELITEIERGGLKNLKTHPQCRSIYISEYLPTFNIHAVEKCEKIIKQYEQNQLFNTYVQQLCQSPGASLLTRRQIGEVQLRLRKYALMFPQTEIDVAASDVDGLYGSKTCQIIANYQIITKSDIINGIADSTLYHDLVVAIPLTSDELAQLTWQPSPKRVASVNRQNKPDKVEQPKPSFKLPTNPFVRIVFCMRNSHIKQCNYSQQRIDLAQADIEHR